MTFEAVVAECLSNVVFMNEYRRLSGSRFGLTTNGTPIEKTIDDACDRPAIDEAEAMAFFEFVKETVWTRLPWDKLLRN